MQNSYTVDVVITNYNEAIEQINFTIKSCLSQSGGFINNIYIVDDGSLVNPIDETNLIKASNIFLIKLINNVGISAARNIGIKKSDAEYIACINVEIILANDWMKACVEIFNNNENIGSVFTKVMPFEKSLLSSWRMHFHEQKYLTTSGETLFAPGHAVLFKKKALQSVSGYNEVFKKIHEDADICYRLNTSGFKTLYTTNSVVYSLQNDTITNLSKKNIIRNVLGFNPNISNIPLVFKYTNCMLKQMSRNIYKLRFAFLLIDIVIYFYGIYQIITERSQKNDFN